MPATEPPADLLRCHVYLKGARCVLVQGHPGDCQQRLPYELINSPPHYNQGLIEHIEYAEDQGWAQGYCLGNATKYIHRAGAKPGNDALQDLKKAKWYLDRYIAWLEHGRSIWKIRKCDEKTDSRDDAGS